MDPEAKSALSDVLANRFKDDTFLTSILFSFLIWKWQFLLTIFSGLSYSYKLTEGAKYLYDWRTTVGMLASAVFYTFVWIHLRGFIERWRARRLLSQDFRISYMKEKGVIDIRILDAFVQKLGNRTFNPRSDLSPDLFSWLAELTKEELKYITKDDIPKLDHLMTMVNEVVQLKNMFASDGTPSNSSIDKLNLLCH